MKKDIIQWVYKVDFRYYSDNYKLNDSGYFSIYSTDQPDILRINDEFDKVKSDLLKYSSPYDYDFVFEDPFLIDVHITNIQVKG